MTAHIRPPKVDAVGVVDAWLSSLRSFRGQLSRIQAAFYGGGAHGWKIATLGRKLAVVVDETFPFTRPRIYLLGPWSASPHVEIDGRLCIGNPEIPSDPKRAVQEAIRLARRLLEGIAEGTEDGDFEEDFSLYWRQSAPSGTEARLLLPEIGRSNVIATCATDAGVYGFSTRAALTKWWKHRFASVPTKPRQGAVIRLTSLPHPDRYPKTGADLWRLVESLSEDGKPILESLLRQMPKSLLIVLAGVSSKGRRHAVGLMLRRPTGPSGMAVNRRQIEVGFRRNGVPLEVLCGRYQVVRLRTNQLDAAISRLPHGDLGRLAAARVAIIGCGSLGSGVARLLAKSGVGHFVLVDPETLGWENIRRHQLGAAFVGHNKATMLAKALAQENPDIGSAVAHEVSVEKLLKAGSAPLANVDLIIGCTASWSANSMMDATFGRGRLPVLYAWMEAHALAAHAVLIMNGESYRTGFDTVGNPRIEASSSTKSTPPECGANTSPFGAIEVGHAENLTSRLALDFLRGKIERSVWKTWQTDATALAEAEGVWTEDWVQARGTPNPEGQLSSWPWWDE